MIRQAVALSTAELLDSSDRELAKKLRVSRTTFKKHFPTVGALISAVVAELDSNEQDVDAELRARAKRLDAERNHDGGLPASLRSRLKEIRLMGDEGERIDATVEALETFDDPSNRVAVATICSHAAYRFVCAGPQCADAAKRARGYAEQGIEALPASHAHDWLRAQLFRTAAAAEQRLAREACADLTDASNPVERAAAERAVLGRMGAVGRLKKEEARLLEDLNETVWAAVARYHSQRAIAITEGRPKIEVGATYDLASFLVGQIRGQVPPPVEVLIPFLIRWCSAEIAYPELFSDHPGGRTHLRAAREEILESLGRRPGYEADSRGLTTMFALADALTSGTTDGHSLPFQDLTAIVTYGTVGQLLVGEYLHDLADSLANRSTGTTNIVAPDVVEATKARGLFEQLLPIQEPELAVAARSHYQAAMTRSLAGGSSNVLVARAEAGLARLAALPGSAKDPHVLPLLRKIGGEADSEAEYEVDINVIQRLALTVVTHKLPTPKEARMLLKEFRPFIAMLNSIANHDAVVDLDDKPAESGRSEPIVAYGPADEGSLRLRIG